MGKKASKRTTSLPKEWPAAKVYTRRVSDLAPYANNARTHSDSQVAKIARSIEEFGWTTPVLVTPEGQIIAGHGRVLAAERLGIEKVPVMVADGWTETQVRAYTIADNQLALEAGWDETLLPFEIQEIQAEGFDLDLLGFDPEELNAIIDAGEEDNLGAADAAALPEVESVVVSKKGDLWILGDHRVLCGDCTRSDDVARVMGDGEIDCIMADPPYGMGKEADGILNDNIYGANLDAFQMEWIELAFRHLSERGSLYIWGNAPDLWRLWYNGGEQGGLALFDDLHLRNEIVWDKGAGFGMTSELQHSYSVATERCLFIMRGQQFLGNQNKEDYWEGWEPLRSWLVEQRNKAGWKNGDVNKITGSHMAGHWFSKSQFQPIGEDKYELLQEAADGVAFVDEYNALFTELFPELRDGGNEHRRKISAAIRESRTYFDNTHEAMTDVWRFNRVHGEERFGHATPKPVAAIGRGLRSSLPEGGLAFDPFLGTGTTLIAADALGSRCYGLELEPAYVDIVVRRWETHSGKRAKLEGTKSTFAQVAKRRTKK